MAGTARRSKPAKRGAARMKLTASPTAPHALARYITSVLEINPLPVAHSPALALASRIARRVSAADKRSEGPRAGFMLANFSWRPTAGQARHYFARDYDLRMKAQSN
jgi:hypothetical protein